MLTKTLFDMATITYHRSHKFTDKNGKEHVFITQLYKVGVYGILDNNSALQGNFTPQNIVKMEKKLEKNKKSGDILDYELLLPITVTDTTGLWQEC